MQEFIKISNIVIHVIYTTKPWGGYNQVVVCSFMFVVLWWKCLPFNDKGKSNQKSVIQLCLNNTAYTWNASKGFTKERLSITYMLRRCHWYGKRLKDLPKDVYVTISVFANQIKFSSIYHEKLISIYSSNMTFR